MLDNPVYVHVCVFWLKVLKRWNVRRNKDKAGGKEKKALRNWWYHKPQPLHLNPGYTTVLNS